jgi:hypothetical protein
VTIAAPGSSPSIRAGPRAPVAGTCLLGCRDRDDSPFAAAAGDAAAGEGSDSGEPGGRGVGPVVSREAPPVKGVRPRPRHPPTAPAAWC